METIVAIRTGEFEVVPRTSKYGNEFFKVAFEINGKKAAMTIREHYGPEAKMESWYFATGDPVIDGTATRQTDFSAFKLVDVDVDISGILADATEFFKKKKEEKEIEERRLRKVKRAKDYDESFFINVLKPALEAKGYSVGVPISKEDFVNNSYSDITLSVDGKVVVGYDFHGWFEARSFDREYDLRINKTTKSRKVEKIVSTIEDVFSTRKYKIAEILKTTERNKTTKETLEGLLGVPILEKTEWHRHPWNRNAPGHETTYFTDENSTMLFVPSGKTFQMRLSRILPLDKVKRIYEIVREPDEKEETT